MINIKTQKENKRNMTINKKTKKAIKRKHEITKRENKDIKKHSMTSRKERKPERVLDRNEKQRSRGLICSRVVFFRWSRFRLFSFVSSEIFSAPYGIAWGGLAWAPPATRRAKE